MRLWLCYVVVAFLVPCLASKEISESSVGRKMSKMFRAKDQDEVNAVLEDIMTSLKGMMKSGDAQYGVPVLDPFIVDKKFDVSNQQLQLKGEFQAEIHNLSNYVVNKLHADMDLNTVVNITLKDLSMTGHYSLHGMAMNYIPISGEGQHSLNFSEFNLAVKPQLEAKNGFLKLISLGLSFYEKKLEVFVEGLFDDFGLSKMLAYFLRDSFSSLLSRNIQLSRALENQFVKSFNGDDGKGKDIFDLVESAKSLGGY